MPKPNYPHYVPRTMSQNLVQYYADRASEYDQVYQKPERQADIRRLRAMVCDLLTGHQVLEIACGTGYWTQDIAQVADSVVGVDVNEPVLEIARDRLAQIENASLLRDDAFSLAKVSGSFDAGFAGFWWSHIKKDALPHFLETFHGRLEHGARVVFVDNRYVPGSNHPITHTDAAGNTYQRRQLADGTPYDVLKNFPDEVELQALIKPWVAKAGFYTALTYYWCFSYQL